MADSTTTLDGAALRRLRALVAAVQGADGRVVPATEWVGWAEDAALEGGVTVDFDAARELGQPLVVLRMPERPDRPECFDALSPREIEVAELVARGLRNKQIAQQLFISVATVKDHVHHILRKTGLDGRAAVAAAWVPSSEG